MVSKKRALFAIFVAVTTTQIIDQIRYDRRLEELKKNINKNVENFVDSEFSRVYDQGWNDAVSNNARKPVQRVHAPRNHLI